MPLPLEVRPEPDEARSWFRRELLDPAYHRENPVERVLRWIQRGLERGLGAAGEVPLAGQLAAMVVLLLLVLALAWVLTRARRGDRAGRPEGAVLTGERTSGAQLRERAERARAEGRWADAVVDGFRALTLHQVEQGAIAAEPDATAREVARALEHRHAAHLDAIERAALWFDLVLYGERPGEREQADEVLALDERLSGVRR